MELLLLKSSVCLLVLLLFYKIALEPLSVHKFKRVYLLVAVAIAAIIPFITFVKYVQPNFENSSLIFDTSPTIPLDTNFKIVEDTNYLPIILWSIYALGVGLFFIRFCINLFQIISKIKKHTKVKSKSFINVLMEQIEVPHTFFNYIFLNKNKFENKQIPAEVLLHEQTHAKQKHSLDIIIIELLQVVFWFNPLVYWLKKEVKLNHEFLADQNVIKQGVDTKTYQNILLQFSSNQQELALVNAINYSSIKKRFTLMKTHTSKKAVWLRSLFLLPLLAGLLFSFSDTKEIEKEVIPKIETKSISTIEDSKKQDILVHDISDYIAPYVETTTEKQKEDFKDLVNNATVTSKNTQDTKLLVNGIECDYCELSLSKEGVKSLILSTSSKDKVLDFRLKIPKSPTQRIKGNKLNEATKKLISEVKKGTVIQIFNINTESKQEIAHFKITIVAKNYSNSPIVKKGKESSIQPPKINRTNNVTSKEIAEYNSWAKKRNNETVNFKNNVKFIPPIDEKALIKYTNIYNRMTAEQKELSEKMPFYGLELKNTDTKLVPPPPPPPVNPNAIPEEREKQERVIKKYYKENKIIKGKVYKNPPPPPTPLNSDTETGFININDEAYFFVTTKNKTKYYNKSGIEVDKKGNKLSTIPTDGSKVIPGQKITKVYKDGKVFIKFKKTWKDDDLTLPPPPPPMKTTDQIISMAKKDASFYYNGEAITSDKALDLVKNNSELNISSHTNNGVSTVHLSEKPIKTVNGKVVNE